MPSPNTPIGGEPRIRALDTEKLAFWSIPIGAVVITVAFLAGLWMASPRGTDRTTMTPRARTAGAARSALPAVPATVYPTPPAPVVNRPPDPTITITPVMPYAQAGPPTSMSRATPFPSAPPYPTPLMRPGTVQGFPREGRPNVTRDSGGFVLPSPAVAGGPTPSDIPDDDTARLARAREVEIREQQARIEQERSLRMAALDTARRAAEAERARRGSRAYSRSPAGRTAGTADRQMQEARRRNDAFLGESDFRDERRGSNGW